MELTDLAKRLPDGRLHIPSFDDLSVTDAMDVLRKFKIQHIVWLDRFDEELTSFAGNFGMTFQRGAQAPPPGHVEPRFIVVVGDPIF